MSVSISLILTIAAAVAYLLLEGRYPALQELARLVFFCGLLGWLLRG